jgi:predicted AAA+ superfamily ATPase
LIGIKGPRGVGKTTLLLQYLKKKDPTISGQFLYASLDHVWFLENTLYDLASDFQKQGGKILALDEVHRYPNWSQELKNIYDDFSDLKVVFTGSSLLQILNARADLSRRALVFQMQGLSFREFLCLETKQNYKSYSISDILEDHTTIASEVLKKVKPFAYFDEYLLSGYYPFYLQSRKFYHEKIAEVINMILEIELPLLRNTDVSYARKLKQLLLVLSESVPFVPNFSKLAERLGLNRKTLLLYIDYLHDAQLVKTLHKEAKGITRFQKPDKLLPDNTNIPYALSKKVNKGTLRETFFVNQVGYQHDVKYPEKGDYKINDRYVVEIGGKGKNAAQISNIDQSYLVIDDIEIGYANKIPLWLFGFLY